MHLAHLGIAVFIIGVTMVKGYETEKDVKMGPGDTVEVGGYQFTLLGVREAKGPNYIALIGDVDVTKNGRPYRRMTPEKRIYKASGMPMTETAIDSGLLRDLYISLGEPIDRRNPGGEWAVRVYHKPFVGWIWGGCLLMSLGGFVSICDRRYRVRATAAATPSATQPAQSA